MAHTTELQYPGLTDAAGNPLDDTHVPGEGTKDFIINFDIQPQPVYITSMALESTYNAQRLDGHRHRAVVLRASARRAGPTRATTWRPRPRPSSSTSPTRCRFRLPQPTAARCRSTTPAVQLIQSANTATGHSDGDFGNLGEGGLGSTGTWLHRLAQQLHRHASTTTTSTTQAWTLVTTPAAVGHAAGVAARPRQHAVGRRLSGLHPQPGRDRSTSVDTRIFDIYGNQLDGENLGNQTSQSSPDFNNPDAPLVVPNYEDLRADGTNRQDDMSGDGVAGGAFMAGVHRGQLRQRRLRPARLRREPAGAQHALQRQPGQSLPGAGARGQSRTAALAPIPTHNPQPAA